MKNAVWILSYGTQWSRKDYSLGYVILFPWEKVAVDGAYKYSMLDVVNSLGHQCGQPRSKLFLDYNIDFSYIYVNACCPDRGACCLSWPDPDFLQFFPRLGFLCDRFFLASLIATIVIVCDKKNCRRRCLYIACFCIIITLVFLIN